MKQIILLILTILFSFGKGYSQYSITLDSSFNFGDKERFLKQSTGLKGYVVAAQVNKRGNYLIAGNGLEVNHKRAFSGGVFEVSPKGELIRSYDQSIPTYTLGNTYAGISDMFVNDTTGDIYLLDSYPEINKNLRRNRVMMIIVLNQNLEEIKRYSISTEVPNFEEIYSNHRFIYSDISKELFVISRYSQYFYENVVFKVGADELVKSINYPNYNFFNQNFAFAGDKLLALNYYDLERVPFDALKIKLSYLPNNELPDTSLHDKLGWDQCLGIYKYSSTQALVIGKLKGVEKVALINQDLTVDTSSLVINNIKTKNLTYRYTIGNRVYFQDQVKRNASTTVESNNYF
ncbi:MAG: hypothetical protein ACOVMN_03700, partial [Flexibacteraceae bacterium]